jgi:hypothetical protein
MDPNANRRPIRLPSLHGKRRREIERELASHLEESRRDLVRSGLTPEEAERQSLIRLGDPSEIADGFARVYRPRLSARLAVACGLAASLFVGAYSSGAIASGASAHHAHTTVRHAHTVSGARLHAPQR